MAGKVKGLLVKPFKDFPWNKNGTERIELENELEAFQKAVDGYIKVIGLEYNVVAVVNEEGKLKNLEPCRTFIWAVKNGRASGDVIRGQFIVIGVDDEGEFISLTEEQLDRWETEMQFNYVYV